jgi:hypothetical protein
MSRIENSEGLFGSDSCERTILDVKCDLCKHTYPSCDDRSGDTNDYVLFAGLEICPECYERIEKAVLQNMPLIIPWFIKIIKKREEFNEKDKKLISELKDELAK